MEEADAIIFVVDGQVGLTSEDEALASMLRRTKKPVIVCVNKTDSFKNNFNAVEFYSLGFGEPIPVSSLHGMNTGDLLDAVIAELPRTQEEEEEMGIRDRIPGILGIDFAASFHVNHSYFNLIA